ncbi:hypothetical protein K440DRAFT_644181 [Wilcoxina mikolae CBS 423.85]|nr:hypothetical protein K440DRAFT_644181 [Wilcoxina mikolae CBS 423.85]
MNTFREPIGSSSSGPSNSQLPPKDWPKPPTNFNVTKLSYGFSFGKTELKRRVAIVGNCARTRTTTTSISVIGFEIRRTAQPPLEESVRRTAPQLEESQPNLIVETGEPFPRDRKERPVQVESGLSVRVNTDRYFRDNRYTVVDRIEQYIVVGVFNKDSNTPREVIVELGRDSPLSSGLWRGVIRARGWRYFLSLKVCDTEYGSHHRITLDTRKQQIVNQIYYEYVTGVNSDAWNEWIFNTIADQSLSIELLLGWSVVRISVVVSFPVLSSFAIGMWYMQTTGDVQTAWTIASYVITGVGVIIALFGVITAIGDV